MDAESAMMFEVEDEVRLSGLGDYCDDLLYSEAGAILIFTRVTTTS